MIAALALVWTAELLARRSVREREVCYRDPAASCWHL